MDYGVTVYSFNISADVLSNQSMIFLSRHQNGGGTQTIAGTDARDNYTKYAGIPLPNYVQATLGPLTVVYYRTFFFNSIDLFNILQAWDSEGA